jgi:hypothetical protein
MATLKKLLEKFPDDYIVQRYNKQLSETWTSGRYYLGGQIPLRENDEITDKIITDVSMKLFIQPVEFTNSWEASSFKRSQNDFLHFLEVMSEYKS